jgi:HK97 family phage major capsid protein
MSHRKTPPDLSRLIGKTIERTFTLKRDAVNTENRTVELAFSSETPVERWFGLEILDHSPEACDLSRVDAGACPLLVHHDPTDLVGITQEASIDPDKVGRAIVRFGKSDRAQEIFQDVQDGIRNSVSVRYMINEMVLQKTGDQSTPDEYLVTNWTPVEISLEPIPADYEAAGVGRELDENKTPVQTPALPTPPNSERTQDPVMETANTPAVNPDQVRRDEILALGELAGQREFAVDLLLDEPVITVDQARAKINAKRKETKTAKTPTIPAENLAPSEDARVLAYSYASKPRNFKGKSTEEAARKAYRFGQFMLATSGNSRAVEFCRENGITLQRAQQENINEKGGALVPPEFGNDLIDLREEFGVARRLLKVVPMASDQRTDPRRTGGLTAYFVDESGAGTQSEKNWDRITLSPKKVMVLARYSSELNEDSVVNLGDDLAGEVAYAFAQKEDDCAFNGDATSTYGGITGIRTKLKGLSGTIANIAGLAVATGTGYGTDFSSLVLADLHKTKGRLPQYALRRGPSWVMSQTVWSEVVEKLLFAAGGNNAFMIAAGAPPALLGYPVEISQVMPSTSAVSQVTILFGYFPLAGSLGNRRDTTIAMSEHSRFANDEIEIKGTERFDINIHDVGNANATASLRVPGPVVGLITGAS